MRALIWTAVSSQAQADEDKMSLPQQESEARAVCAANGWEVIAVLCVPGHSRSYFTIAECAHDMRQRGITAFDDLLHYIETQAFDVFVCRDADRIGRKSSLVHEVIGRIIDMGASIHTLQGGSTFKSNGALMYGAFAGYKAQAEIDSRVELAEKGRIKRVERGLPVGRKPPLTHILIRDHMGRGVELIVDESRRRLWDDMACIVLSGVGWNAIENTLFHDYGHIDPKTGLGYPPGFVYKTLYRPTTWGHMAYGHHRTGQSRTYGTWVYDQRVTPPDGIIMHYNLIPPLYAPEMMQRLQDEMRRREGLIQGRRRPGTTSMFAGLVVCGECGHPMRYHKNGAWYTYRCEMRYGRKRIRRAVDCTQTRQTRLHVLIDFMKELFAVLREGADLTTIAGVDAHSTALKQLAAVETELEQVRDRIRRAVHLQINAPELEDVYAAEISTLRTQQDALEKRAADLRKLIDVPTFTQMETQRRQTILDMPDSVFWERPSQHIHQDLAVILKGWKIEVIEGQIVGLRRG